MSRLGTPAAVVALLLAGTASAAPPDPLRYVPESAQIVVTVENPRNLAEAVTGLGVVKEAQELAPVRAVLDSTTARRFYQMLAYLERELGAKWPELLDQTAGGGVAFGFRFGVEAPAILVIQGTDEKQVAKAFDLLARVLEDELVRQGSKDRPVKGTYKGAETVRVGDVLHAARAGATVIVSNKANMLTAALDIPAAGKPAGSVLAKKSLRDARKLLPKDPLAWLWLDFASVKQGQATKDFFDATRKDFLQTLVVGGTIDCLRRADFVTAGVYREPTGFRLAVRLPAGRSEFPPEFALHVPEKGVPGSLPLLEPPGVVYSQSFYLDVGYYWKHRDKLINDQMRKQLEEGEKQLSKVLPGSVKFGELLEMWGPHHRIVVLNHDALPYKIRPAQRLPAFGYVATMRDPKFGISLDSALRSAGLIASLQFGLKQSDLEHDGVKIVAYRFPEGKTLAEDPDGLRFNFEPCFAVVGDHFVAASTVEVGKKLIAELKRTADRPASPAVWRGKGYAAGVGLALTTLPDPLVTDAILRGGVGIEDARQQVETLAAWVKTLGTARIEIDEAETEYRFDLVWDFRR
ncbi:MAG: hypothetical protein JWO38_5435 [Gemmataceae bacterium]|nr:hypothetical protein [Gemmataceae bacterium]